MKKHLFVFIVVGLLFAGIGTYVGVRVTEPAAASPKATERFFSSSFSDVSGQQQPVSQWKDKKLVINFWATWCAPCVEEMPELSSLQDELRGKNTHILGIGIDSPSNIQEFSAKYKISYPLYVAGLDGTELSRLFGNKAGGLPFTVLISEDGKIRQTYLGRLDMKKLRQDLARL